MPIKPMRCTVHAFYKFVSLPDYRALQAPLRSCCERAGLLGTILLAAEGVNGTVAGSAAGLQALWEWFGADARFDGMQPRTAVGEREAFYRMKVRLKQEIVSLGVPGIDPTTEVGTYVEPEDWNTLIRDPGVCVVDTRNEYEYEVGTFEGAVNPHTRSFREFPGFVCSGLDPQKQDRVALFCTGGIRCEKATAFLLQQGFKQVYHLKGGILNYLESVPEAESLWQGECFVFDNRVTVNHALHQGHYDLCHACRHPITDADKQSPHYERGVSCPRCADRISADKKQRIREREKQMRLAEQRHEKHLGKKMK